MTDMLLLQVLVSIHNRLIQIPVSGDGAIQMGDCIRELRSVLSQVGDRANANSPPENHAEVPGEG